MDTDTMTIYIDADACPVTRIAERVAKEYASRDFKHFQNVIWSSIDRLEHENSFSSPTAAMEESYENLKINHNKIIKEFDTILNRIAIEYIYFAIKLKAYNVF